MPATRRFLPPVQWLTAFEAVARLGSVTAAAQELSLTQGAVSRQIQKLEDVTGAGHRARPMPQRSAAGCHRSPMQPLRCTPVPAAGF